MLQESCIYIMIDSYEIAFKQMKNEVKRILSTSPHIIREYTEHLAETSGKYIRGSALLICAEREDGTIHENGVKLAAAIEILHLATLVHDDVIDNADLRRGGITLQKKYGKRTAVICGDYLMCVALKLVASASNKEDYLDLEIPDYLNYICLGELNQHINNGNFDLTVYQYLKIIYGKTAALFEASFYAGAILSETDENVKKKYAKMGRYVGMIFQLTDDCMDFETTESVAKKPVQSDYEQDVITLPLIHAFRNFKHLRKKAEEEGITRKEVNEGVRKAGGLNYTRAIAKKYYNKYQITLDELAITEDKRARLISILDKAYRVF